MAGDAGFFDTLRSYRERKNFEGVKSVEDSAKIFLQQLVNYELSKMGIILAENMSAAGFNPEIHDLDYWLFQHKCVGSLIEYAGPELIEKPLALPTKRDPDPMGTGQTFPGPYFTPGGQFRVAIDDNPDDRYGYAEEYVGYYHIHIDDMGNEIYRAGSTPDDEARDTIVPVADQIQIGTIKKIIEDFDPDDPDSEDAPTPLHGPVDLTDPIKITEEFTPIGDVPEWLSGGGTTEEKPFKIEKYVSINGTKSTTSSARATINTHSAQALLSDVYPGTLRVIKNDLGQEVGIEGKLGVRHGLAFYLGNQVITTVEVDALDFRIDQFQVMQPNSKLLHCLLTQLKHDPVYKLLTSYIFSLKKVTGTLAIYNDMAFLASIGEVTPGEDDDTRHLRVTKKTDPVWPKTASTTTRSHWLNNAAEVKEPIKMKPGSRAYVAQTVNTDTHALSDREKEIYGLPEYWDDPLTFERIVLNANKSGETGNEGWSHPKDRPNATPFSLHWDEWDRVLLRNSRARIKKMFRRHYYSANKKPGQRRERMNPAKIKMRNLKARIFPAPGRGLLPWWKRRKMKQNPYNADGDMCNGPDILGNE